MLTGSRPFVRHSRFNVIGHGGDADKLAKSRNGSDGNTRVQPTNAGRSLWSSLQGGVVSLSHLSKRKLVSCLRTAAREQPGMDFEPGKISALSGLKTVASSSPVKPPFESLFCHYLPLSAFVNH
jgi:hypothetical protein